MSWLLEDPTILIVVGAIVEALMAAALFITGRLKWIASMAGVLAVVGLLVLVERLVVTEREQIERVIYDLADAVESGQTLRVIGHISPENKALVKKAKRLMPMARIREVKFLDDPMIELVEESDPPYARVQVSVMLVGTIRYPTQLEIWFRKKEDRWRVDRYKDLGPRAAFRD